MQKPVMLKEVLETLSPRNKETYIDATFGAGGYSRALLETAECSVIALDRDPEAEVRSQELKTLYQDRFSFHEGRFGQMDKIVPPKSYDGVVFDLGLSSPQVDQRERGFSFKTD